MSSNKATSAGTKVGLPYHSSLWTPLPDIDR
jgi:hypothetical protein